MEIRELPCRLDFRDCPTTRWQIGPAQITAEGVTHRGPTLGFRVEESGSSLCYLPDHEPAIIGNIDQLEAEWLSGLSLARDVDLLIHDCQYTDAEYPAHVGWGHSSLTHALQFARRVAARNTLLFHHDPGHTDDELDAMLDGSPYAVDGSRRPGERNLDGRGGHPRDRRVEHRGDQVVITCGRMGRPAFGPPVVLRHAGASAGRGGRFAGRAVGRTRLLDKLKAAARAHPPAVAVDLHSLADQVFTTFEGGFILARAMDDPSHLRSQLTHLRHYLELLFQLTPTAQCCPGAHAAGKARAHSAARG